MTLISKRTVLIITLLFSLNSLAVEVGIGFLGGSTGSEQNHLNNLRTEANTREGGISTSELDSAWEGGLMIQWKESFFAFQLRPTYFYQLEDGTGSSGAFEYSVMGQTYGALFKLYPLSNQFMRLFFQSGVTYGMLQTEIKEGSFNAQADGNELGYQVGAGIEMMMGSHAFLLEVGWRYLAVDRLVVSASSGTPDATSVSQYAPGQELEYGNRDLGVNMSGVQLFVGYMFIF